MRAARILVLLVVSLALACGGDASCVTGATLPCECCVGPMCSPGTQTCEAERFGACVCSGVPTDAGGDASGDAGSCIEGADETRPTDACGEETRSCTGGAWSEWSETRAGPADPECLAGEALFAGRDGCTDRKVRYQRCGTNCRWETEVTACGGGCDGVRRTAFWDEEEICVPAGLFTRGCEDPEQDCFPRHDIYLSAFYIDRNTVTVGRYQRCVDAGACTPLEPFTWGERTDRVTLDDLEHGLPDISAWTPTYEQAVAFCVWDGAALATGAQWERAATGIHDRVMWPFTDNLSADAAWCDHDAFGDEPGPADQTPECGGPTMPPRHPRENDFYMSQSSIGVSNYYRYFEWTADTMAPYRPMDPPERDPVLTGFGGTEMRGSPAGAHTGRFRRHVAARNETLDDDNVPSGVAWGDANHASIRCSRPTEGTR